MAERGGGVGLGEIGLTFVPVFGRRTGGSPAPELGQYQVPNC